MADELFVFNKKDIAILKSLIEREKRKRQNPQSPLLSDFEGPDPDGQEIYVAKLKAPATEIAEIDDGSSPPIVSAEECEIFKLVQESGDGKLRVVPNLTAFVYNIGPAPIPDDEWVFVQRDKFGDWYTRGSL